jgi:hypothetical protein
LTCISWSVTLLALDASSIVYAWDNYPIAQFGSVWQWIAAEIAAKNLCIASVALTEVEHNSPDCAAWLDQNNIQKLQIGAAELAEAMRIKAALGIVNDEYHPNGVGENDILIIAAARIDGVGVVSDEAVQLALPKNLKKYKIPAVCARHDVQVPCQNFVSLLKASGKKFG